MEQFSYDVFQYCDGFLVFFRFLSYGLSIFLVLFYMPQLMVSFFLFNRLQLTYTSFFFFYLQ